MMTVYTTNIESVNTYKNVNGLQAVVFFIKFYKEGVSPEGFKARYTDWVYLDSPDANAFTNYAQVTEEMMLGWVYAAKPEFEAAATQYIDMKIEEERASNIIENHILPWQMPQNI